MRTPSALLLVIAIASGGSCTAPRTVEPAVAPVVAPATVVGADPILVDGDLAAYSAFDTLPSVPDDATHLFVHDQRFVDGHITIVRYTSTAGASAAVCLGICDAAHHVDVLPELFPTREELHAPAWFTAPTGGGHVVIDATPYRTEIGGEQVPCGFSRATGHGVFVEGATVTMLDWSLQWFRTGCGG